MNKRTMRSFGYSLVLIISFGIQNTAVVLASENKPRKSSSASDCEAAVKRDTSVPLGTPYKSAAQHRTELNSVDWKLRAKAAAQIGDIVAWGLRSRPGLRDEIKGFVPDLVKLLSDESSCVRRQAAIAFYRMHDFPEAKSAGPALKKLLKDSDEELRFEAAIALAEIDATSRDTIPFLSQALFHSSYWYEDRALEALASMKEQAEDALPALREKISKTYNYKDMQYRTAITIYRISPFARKEYLPFLKQAAIFSQNKEAGIAKGILKSLSEPIPGENGEPLEPYLKEMMSFGDYQIQSQAADKLGGMGTGNLDLFVEQLKSDDYMTRTRAASGLEKMCNTMTSAQIPKLIGLFQYQQGNHAAANCLKEMGEPAVTSLIEALNNRYTFDQGCHYDEGWGNACPAVALVWIFRDRPELVDKYFPALNSQLQKSSDSDVKERITWIFENLDSMPSDAVPSLLKALEDKNPRVQETAIQALSKIDPPVVQAVAPLIKIVENGDYNVQDDAFRLLEKIGPTAHTALPSLIKVMQKESVYGSVRMGAVAAIKSIDPNNREAKTILVRLIQSDKPELKETGIYGVGEFKITTEPVVKELIKALESGNRTLRDAAARTLTNFGTAAKPAVPTLLNALKYSDSYCADPTQTDDSEGGADTNCISIALGQLGKVIDTVRPGLMKALKNQDSTVRANAELALRFLGE